MYTVILRPIPKHVDKQTLIADYLSAIGEVRDVRFPAGSIKSASSLYIDFYHRETALSALTKLREKNFFPGGQTFSIELTISTKQKIELERKYDSTELGPKQRFSVVDVIDGSKSASSNSGAHQSHLLLEGRTSFKDFGIYRESLGFLVYDLYYLK
jgi:hypothetical protein